LGNPFGKQLQGERRAVRRRPAFLGFVLFPNGIRERFPESSDT
jgi:hypothetical protein